MLFDSSCHHLPSGMTNVQNLFIDILLDKLKKIQCVLINLLHNRNFANSLEKSNESPKKFV